MIINPFKNRKTAFLLPLLIVGFVALYFKFGVLIASDSDAYLKASIRVSPLYPALLSLFKTVFGQNGYLSAVVIFQEILVAYSIFSLMSFVGTRFSLRTVTVCILTLLFTGIYLSRLFLTGPETLYCNVIMTEALTYPLFYLFVKYAFSAWDSCSPKAFTTAAVLAFLMASTRGQLFSLFPVLAVLFFVLLGMLKKRSPASAGKFRVRGILITVCYFGGVFLFSALYHYGTAGTFSSTSMGREAVFTAVLYNSDASDMEMFDQNSEEYQLLRKTMDMAESDGITHRGSSGGCYRTVQAL